MADSFMHTDKLSIGYKADKPLYTTEALQLKPQSLTIIAGRNGCGKSTLLLSLAGLQKTLAGKVYFDNTPITAIPVRDRATLFSMVLTGRIRNQYLQVMDVLKLAVQAHTGYFAFRKKNDQSYKSRRLEKNAITKAEETATRCKIDHLLYNSINHLSDGEYQRVMIARALAQDTPLIMLDEPVAHLDPVAQQKTFHLLRELVDKDGKMILAATHAFDWAFHHADELWLIDLENNFSVMQREHAEKEALMLKLYGEF